MTPSERRELRERLRSRTVPAEDVRRARLIRLLAQGQSYLAIPPGSELQRQLHQSLERPFRG